MSLDWRNLPSLSSLRAFDATARNSGFSGAARSLNVTHAAVAQQVRSLEKELGVQLVVRTGRSVSLTEAGARLALAFGKGFATISDGIEDLRKTEGRRGLRITTTAFIVDAVIIPRLSEFWEKYPGIEIALLPSPNYVDIVKEGFDFAIRAGSDDYSGSRDWPGMDAVHLARCRAIAVGAPSLIGEGTTDLAKLPWIWTADNAGDRFLMTAAGLDLEKLQKVELGSYNLALVAARQGLGLTVAAELVIRDDLAAGRLQEAPISGFPDINYYAVIPKGPRREVVVQFVTWLKTIF